MKNCTICVQYLIFYPCGTSVQCYDSFMWTPLLTATPNRQTDTHRVKHKKWEAIVSFTHNNCVIHTHRVSVTAKDLLVHRYPWKRQFFRSEKPRRYLQFGIHGICFIPAMKCKFKERKDLICSPNLHNTQVRSSVTKPFGQDISLPAIGKAGFSL